ncbi:MAG: hypothetical protein CM1200mP15_20770 [Dehalococcoidia bacterium]|nr:MAG: hypothetical protein CM1200mP15_20770 [Dehalococcoidia bacterium]
MRTLPLSALGQHTDETLLELGYPQVEIDPGEQMGYPVDCKIREESGFI